MREVGSVTRLTLERALVAANLRLGEVLEVDSREAVQAAVLVGLGVGMIAENEFADDPRLTLLDLEDAVVPITEYLAVRIAQEQAALIMAVRGCIDKGTRMQRS